MREFYSSRKAPLIYSPGWLDFEHQAVQRGISKLGKRVFNVEDAGPIGNGSEAEDAATIAAAIRDTPEGDELQFPIGHFKIPNLVTGKRIGLAGAGWWNAENSAFGNSVWDGSGQYGGTILQVSDDAGIGLEHGVPGGYAPGLHLRDLMILGPGGGTSIGLQLGHANNEGAVQAQWSNVLVANFAQAYRWQTIFECEMRSIRARGCKTGMSFADEANNNDFYTWEVQFSDVDAILFDNSKGNTFHGGLLQNCINKGIRTQTGSYGNWFFGPWLENYVGITDVVDFASGVKCGIFGGIVSKGNVKIGDANCAIINQYSVAGATLETTVGGTGAVLINSRPAGGYTLNGAYPIVMDLDQLIATSGIFYEAYLTNFLEGIETADPAAPAANKGRLYFRDNGAGKTQLCARFPTGAVQVVATEP
jgi:hypothetical protein